MKKSKAKTSKKSDKSPLTEQQGLLDLVSAMAKIAERLEGLEKKMDQIIHQTSAVPALVSVQKFDQPHAGHERHSEHQGSNHNQNPQQNNNRHARLMYKAVCADCRKDCEVPFKPAGDRPIYCKECFALRKANQHGKSTIEIPTHGQDILDEIGRAAVATAPAPVSTKTSAKAKGSKFKKKSKR